MTRWKHRGAATAAAIAVVLMVGTVGQALGGSAAGAAVVRAALPPGSINNVLVINLENESFSSTFGATSPATYLNQTLVPKGVLLNNYYATGHVSLDNYIAQISGQAPDPLTNSDCAGVVGGSLVGQYVNVSPGNDDPNGSTYPGQVDGNGCVYPAPTATTTGAPTIADQLDAAFPPDPVSHVASWREYAEDMGNDPTRDGGTADPLGGTDCAHPAVGGTDSTEAAEAADSYTTRHNPFMFFHSIIDNSAECRANVVPAGTVSVGTPSTFNGTPFADTFTGHLANDLSSTATTPRFGFITPNLCDDGHDGTCAGANVEGGKTGGLVGADLWLKHWMPLILASPAYKSGQMLVTLTFDEGSILDTTACCNEQPGPNWGFPGFSPLLGTPPTTAGADPGGGRVGALLLNAKYIQPGTVDTTGSYNHYSALRSYEDLLGLTSGGTDGLGHLGFAASPGLAPFGQDVFSAPVAPSVTTQPTDQTASPGQLSTFSAAASGTPTPTVQWQISTDGGTTWSNIVGNSTATSTTLSGVIFGTFENGWKVRAVFTNGSGSATTNPATLTVAGPVAPSVTAQPNDQTDSPGQVSTFSAAASGTPTPTVQWQISTDGGTTWSNIAGNSTATSTTLRGVIFGTFENGWKVRAVFTNGSGSATTNPATLTVQ